MSQIPHFTWIYSWLKWTDGGARIQCFLKRTARPAQLARQKGQVLPSARLIAGQFEWQTVCFTLIIEHIIIQAETSEIFWFSLYAVSVRNEGPIQYMYEMFFPPWSPGGGRTEREGIITPFWWASNEAAVMERNMSTLGGMEKCIL